MRFGVLGPLVVWDGQGAEIRVREVKVRALLADLLVHEGRVVSADRLIDDLWGDGPPGNPGNALQAKVSQLRRALGRDRVLRGPPGYRLRIEEEDEVDADRFGHLVDRARQTAEPRARVVLLTEALRLWRGPAFADFADDEFARGAAERLAEQRLAVLEDQAEARLESGDRTLLVGELADLVARHPLRERLRAVHMRALYLAGRQDEALASYAEVRTRLADELGLDPGPELLELHQAILRQDASLAPVPPAGTREAASISTGPPGAPPSNLPVPLTTIVGRDDAVSEVVRLLGAARLVTLTGMGGVGKTRLAVEAGALVARDAGPDVPDGVWLVEFAGRSGGPADLTDLVAAALGVREDVPSGMSGVAEHRSPTDRLVAAVRDRRMLLILDNCEHVVEPAARLVQSLLRLAPGLRVLTTSQEPLGVAGEAVLPVEPLGQEDAIRLFAERAAAVAPGFALDAAGGETRDAVAEICRRLDGIPLALELAATRVRALGARDLAARLGDRFRLLSGGRRGVPERQRTLRAMLDWSWDLLSAPERAVLRRLAVHRDGCTLDGAEAVCAGDGVPREEVAGMVVRLVDRSLVARVDGPAGPRYRLLESVAMYARERLEEAEDAGAVRERHLHHYLDLAERAEARVRGAEQPMWLARLDAEAANLRVAVDAALDRRASAEAVRLATALSWWWLLRGRLSEGHRVLSDVRAAAPAAAELGPIGDAFALLTGQRAGVREFPVAALEDQTRRGRATWLVAFAHFHGGDPATSAEINARALDAATAAGDRWGVAAALALRAMHALVDGDLAGVERDGRRSAEIFRELGDRWGELQTVQPLAALAEITGDYEAATRLQSQGLRIAWELDLPTETCACECGLGRLALLARDWDRARELHERARRRAAAQGHKYGEIRAEMGLALGERRGGDVRRARERLLRMRERFAGLSSPAGDHLLNAELGFIAEMLGDRAEAAAHHLLGWEIASSLGEPRAMALSLEGMAGAVVLEGSRKGARCAALLLGAADTARRSAGAPLPPAERGDVDRSTAAAQAVLGRAGFQEAFRHGAELTPRRAAAAARTRLTPVSRPAGPAAQAASVPGIPAAASTPANGG